MLTACERRNDPVPTTNISEPAATQTAILPTTMPVLPAAISIDQQIYEFPPASVLLINRDDQIIAQLSTDDPPQATQDDYAGNSFYLEMPLDVTGNTLGDAQWQYKTADMEREEGITGIFLNGRKKVLQPFDVRVGFNSSSSPMLVLINGTFLLFDNQDAQAPVQKVSITGQFPARVHVQSSARPATAR
ncbi:MAG TPA: hypothetical protein VHD56_04695 [Tepidisphaeraceae bacterium]|nr:hypothetical protein [Tepidisphaeraceae bacterium]